jgi:shikimate kinase
VTNEHPQAGRPGERGRPQAVALVGFMGAGKSAVGRELSTALGIPFVDTDDLIVASAGPIAAIFAERGEAGFRALEADVVTAAVSAAADSPCVLALGGGAVLSAAVREALKTLPHVVWLAAPPEELWARVAGEGPRARPLAVDEPTFKQLLAGREPLYRAVATEVVETSGRTPMAIAAAVAAGLAGVAGVVAGTARVAEHRSGGGS